MPRSGPETGDEINLSPVEDRAAGQWRNLSRKVEMMKKSILSLATGATLALSAISAPTDVLAQGRNCAPRDAVVERLAERYGESRQSIGLGPNNQVVEVFASTETGTWTITVTTAQGLTCLVASGQAFETLAEALPASGNDA